MKRSKDWKGCPPRVTRIGIVDDDADNRRQFVELLEEDYPTVTVRAFETIYQAYQGFITYDYLLLDLSSFAPQMMGDLNHVWGPISKYASEHPKTEFVFISATSRNAVEDVIDDCVTQGKVERRRLHYGGFMWSSDRSEFVTIQRTLQGLIKPEDLVWSKVKTKLKK